MVTTEMQALYERGFGIKINFRNRHQASGGSINDGLDSSITTDDTSKKN